MRQDGEVLEGPGPRFDPIMQRTPCNRADRKATSLLQLALVGLLTSTNLQAQQAVGPPRLVQTGRAFARSDGVVTHCMFTADASRALTIGRERDLVWWDLRARKPLRLLEPPEMGLQDLLLHPDEPWLVCRRADGSGVRIDLESDRSEALTKPQLDAITPTDGKVWLRGGSPVHASSCMSANGEFRLVRNRIGWEREPSNAQFFNSGDVWIANDGTVVNARGRELEFFGIRRTDRTIASVHCSAPRKLVFTPDGSHLALVSSAQVAVVDHTGNEIARLPGPLLPTPGPGPDEFWLLADEGMQRWNCTQRGYVGERVTWPGHSIQVSGSTPLFGPELPALAPMILHNGQPWTEHYARLPDTSWRRLDRLPPEESVQIHLRPTDLEGAQFHWVRAIDFTTAGGTTKPILLTSAAGSRKFPPRSTLRRFGDDGVPTHQVEFDTTAHWVAISGAHVIVGLGSGYVLTFDSEREVELSRVVLPRPIVDAVATGDALIAICGASLVWMEATNVAKQTDLPLPAGLSGVDQIAISADGRRLAVACRSEVRILTIEK